MSYFFLYLAAINVITFAAMGIDKAKARAGKWRIAEGTLFALAALGGALGGHARVPPQDETQGIPLRLSRAAVPAVRSRGVSHSDLEAGALI